MSDFARALSSRPGLYSFFAAVRRIEQLSPRCPRIGTGASALQPSVHFAQVPHLYFAPSELFGYAAAPGGQAGTLQVYFFGLFGPNGPLPLALTEYVHERSRHYYDLSMQRFADIFHDRLTALFYRAGTAAQVAVSYDRADDDPLSRAAAALSGVPAADTEDKREDNTSDGTEDSTEGSSKGCPLPGTTPVTYARELAGKNRKDSLRRLLERYFRLPVRIIENSPTRLPIGEDSRCRLARPGVCALGRSTLLGSSQRSISERVTLEIGPLSYEQYGRFTPGSTGYRRLQAWLRLMTSRPLSWKLNFRITTDSIPPTALDGTRRLGAHTLFALTSSRTTCCTHLINY